MIDFTDWTREDPNETLTVHEHRVSWMKADRTALRYIGTESKVADDFRHRFVVCIEEGHFEDELNRGLLRL